MTSSLDTLLLQQSERLDDLILATSLINIRKKIKHELLQSQSEVSHMRKELDSLRDDLDKLRDENNSCKELMSLLQMLQEKIGHMECNVPHKLVHDYINTEKNIKSNPDQENIVPNVSETEKQLDLEEKVNVVTNCAKTLFNEPNVYPTIELISPAEFKGIPKYMIGRQSIETLNSFLLSINTILKAKYTLLAKGKSVARKKGEYDLYMKYSKQQIALESIEGKLYFFNAEDYHHYTTSKLDKTKMNLITVLQHCKRLRYLRTGKDIQYVVMMP